MSKAAADLTADQKKDQEALSSYITTTCMGQFTASPSPSN
jgi:hypothetical protein